MESGEHPGITHLRARVLSPDGRKVLNVNGVGLDAAQLGTDLARQAMEQGASEILDLAKKGCM
jgi:porphobilinogen deaminase